jgi:hypothetical protein
MHAWLAREVWPNNIINTAKYFAFGCRSFAAAE